jgi:hypothetical protein
MGLAVTGVTELALDIEGQARRIANPATALEAAAARANRVIAQAFATSASPDGGAFAPRKTTTQRERGRPARSRYERPRRLLEDTGRLRAGTRGVVDGGAIVIESAVPYARFVLFGTQYQPGRSPLPGEQWLDELAEGLADHAVGTEGA